MHKLLLLPVLAALLAANNCFAVATSCNLTISGQCTVVVKAAAISGAECPTDQILDTRYGQDGSTQTFALSLSFPCTGQKAIFEITPSISNATVKLVASQTVYYSSPVILEQTQLSSVQIFASPVNYVETTIHNVNGQGDDVQSRSYTDGLGKPVQSVTKVTNVYFDPRPRIWENSVVSGSVYDELGRPAKSVLPFSYMQYDRLEFVVGDLINGPNCAKNFYSSYAPDAGDYPYSETKYYSDPLGRDSVSGAPGTAFCVDDAPATGGHPSSYWYFGVSGTGTLGTNTWYSTYFGSDGFIVPGKLTKNDLDILAGKMATDVTEAQKAYCQFFLTVVRSPSTASEYAYSQTLTDIFGKTIKTASKLSSSKNVVSSNEYDILGQLTREVPPATPAGIDPTTYTYNKLGQVVTKTTPDAGTTSYTYDEMGRVQTSTDANGTVVENSYDEFGRVFQITANGAIYVLNYYDATDVAYRVVGMCRPDVTAQLPLLKNTVGRLVAACYYPRGFNFPGCPAETIFDLYSYDNEGRIQIRYKSIPGLPLQEFRYGYDIHGKILADTMYSAPGATPLCNSYEYDYQGHLSKIFREPDRSHPLVTYNYDDLGKTYEKVYTNQSGATLSTSYAYNVRNWVTRINDSRGFFDEKLYYNELHGSSEPQFNGNISAVQIVQNATNYREINCNYSYDMLSRLLAAHNVGASGANSGATDDDLDAAYQYDDAGRISIKQEGLKENNSGFCDWGDYVYAAGKSRLRSISSSPRGVVSGYDNFVYDANGNMILDRYKKMIVEYDWRNLPYRFTLYDIAPESRTQEEVNAFVQSPGSFGATRTKEVIMTYDGAGTRVRKEEVVPATMNGDCAALANPNPSDGSFIATDGSAVYKFTATGLLQTCKPIQPLDGPPEATALLWKKDDIAMLVMNPTKLQINKSLVENNSSATASDLLLTTGGVTQAVVTATGNLQMASSNPDRSVATGVVYCDNSVYTYEPANNAYAFSYQNIGSEGHMLASGNFEYFLKDHLGSTRVVVTAQNFDAKEEIDYLPYGRQIARGNTPPPAVRAREKFTGKEFDTDGGDASGEGVDVSLTITDFDPAHITTPVPAMLFLVYNEGMAGYFSNQFYFNISGTTATLNAHAKVDNTAKLTSIRLGTYTNSDHTAMAWNTVIDVNETMTAGKLVEITFPGGSKRISDIVLGTGGPRGSWADPYTIKTRTVVAGMNLYYFGRRYYDAETGKWTGVDPVMEFHDAYSYIGNDPVNGIDIDGKQRAGNTRMPISPQTIQRQVTRIDELERQLNTPSVMYDGIQPVAAGTQAKWAVISQATADVMDNVGEFQKDLLDYEETYLNAALENKNAAITNPKPTLLQSILNFIKQGQLDKALAATPSVPNQQGSKPSDNTRVVLDKSKVRN